MSILFYNGRKLDADGQIDNFWMLVDGDKISRTGTGRAPKIDPYPELIDVNGQWLVPGFIDIHGHGGGGHSYDANAVEIQAAMSTHRAHGTTRSVLSLVANPLAQLHASLRTIADLTEVDPTILGSHLEGPYLAESKCGAHNPAYLRLPLTSQVNDLISAARGTLRQITIAPELPGALEAIDTFVDAGIAVGIGHTEASFELAQQAFDHGANILTHAFNAMNGIHHRAPGPVVAAFGDPRVTIELIVDGHHIHPFVVDMAFRAAPGRIALVTDAMAAAGVGDGDYRLGTLDVTVREALATIHGTETIAGSTITQDVAFRNAVNIAGIRPVDAISALTIVPAKALRLSHKFGLLAAGYAADVLILDHDFLVSKVWANGTLVG